MEVSVPLFRATASRVTADDWECRVESADHTADVDARDEITDWVVATSNSFGRSIIPNWGRTDHDDATKRRNQTGGEGMHDSVAVVLREENIV